MALRVVGYPTDRGMPGSERECGVSVRLTVTDRNVLRRLGADRDESMSMVIRNAIHALATKDYGLEGYMALRLELERKQGLR